MAGTHIYIDFVYRKREGGRKKRKEGERGRRWEGKREGEGRRDAINIKIIVEEGRGGGREIQSNPERPAMFYFWLK